MNDRPVPMTVPRAAASFFICGHVRANEIVFHTGNFRNKLFAVCFEMMPFLRTLNLQYMKNDAATRGTVIGTGLSFNVQFSKPTENLTF